MNLSKRERVLLGMLLVLLAFAGVLRFVMMPLHDRMELEREHLEALSAQKMRMDTVLSDGKLQERYDTETQKAREHYEAFYDTLNTYTIDNSINSLLEEHGLHVQKLTISPYAPVPEEMLLGEQEKSSSSQGEEEQEQENLLLLSTVDLIATGSYERAKAFVDALNEKSFCLQVEDLQIDFGDENEFGDEARMAATVRIYGIDTPEGVVGLT